MIHLSAAAVREVTRLKSKHQNLNAHLRLGVKYGGCSGLYYTMEFDAELGQDDRIYECNGIWVAIDAQTLNYLSGLALDYSEDLMGGGFRFHNPNATASCSCGHSFSMSDPPRP